MSRQTAPRSPAARKEPDDRQARPAGTAPGPEALVPVAAIDLVAYPDGDPLEPLEEDGLVAFDLVSYPDGSPLYLAEMAGR